MSYRHLGKLKPKKTFVSVEKLQKKPFIHILFPRDKFSKRKLKKLETIKIRLFQLIKYKFIQSNIFTEFRTMLLECFGKTFKYRESRKKLYYFTIFLFYR